MPEQKFLTNLNVAGTVDLSNLTIDSVQGTDGQVLTSTGSGVAWENAAGTSETAERIEVTVKNVSGGSLSKGTVVHASPSATPPSGNVIEVIAADYDDSTKMPAIGILNETIANEAEGSAVMMGAVSGIDTSSFSIGDELYVGNLGTLTNSKPATAGQLIQKIAVVIKSHASNGLIKIFGAGRSNDVPLPLYIDNANQRVGIGDSTPSYTLDVNGTIYGSAVRSGRYYGISGTSSYLDLDSGAPYSLLASSEVNVTSSITCNDLTATETGGIAATNGPVYANRFHGNGNTTYYVDPNDSTTSAILAGNVGIGTTSPDSMLHLKSTGDVKLILEADSDNTGENDNPLIELKQDGGGIISRFGNVGDAGQIFTNSRSNSTGLGSVYQQDLILFTENSARVYIKGENGYQGRVGIGRALPSQTLDVNGNVTANRYYGNTNTNFYIDPNDGTTAAKLAGGLEIGYGGNGEYRIEVGEGRIGNGYAYIDFVGDTTYSDYGLRLIRNNSGANTSSQLVHRGTGNLEFKTWDAGDMIFSTANTERMQIASGGYVQATNSFRAPIFYDSANSNFHWNPNTDNSHRFTTPSGYLDIGPKNTSWCHLYTDRNGFYFNKTTFQLNGNQVFHDGYHPNADTWTTGRTITIGDTGKTVDGSADVSWSLSEIGAAASSHTHAAGDITSGTFSAARIAHNSFDIGDTTAETGRSVHETGIYTFNRNNGNLGTGTNTSYYSVLAYGQGAGGSAQIATEWTNGGNKLYFRSLRDVTDNWWDWKEIYHTGHKPTYSELGTMAYSNLTGTPTIPTNYLRDDAFDTGVGLYLTGGSYNAGTDTATAALVIDEEDFIYTKDGSYLRRLIGKTGDQIQIGHAGTGLISSINFLPGTAGNSAVKINSNTVWNAGNDGSGSGLDADLLDGQQGSYYDHRGYTIDNNYLGGYYVSGGIEKPNDAIFGSGKFKVAMLRGGSTNLGFGGTWNDVFWLSSYNGGDVKKSVALVSSKYDSTSLWIAKQDFDSSSWGTGYLFWNSGNDGSGSGLDADLLDGVQGSGYLRSDANDTFTGKLSVGDTNIRRAGIYGLYDSYRIGHIWSMGTNFNIANDGADFGNLYGLAYKHTNNTTGGTMGGSHQMVWCNNGSARGSIGNNAVWHAESMKAPIYYDGNNTSYYGHFDSTGDSIRAAGDIVAYYSSDKIYKENIKLIESPIEKVKAISGVTFEWNEKSHKETGKKDVGVIAQEVEEVLPEIVETRDNGYKAVDYQKLTAVLIEAVKDQQKQIDELKSIINGGS